MLPPGLASEHPNSYGQLKIVIQSLNTGRNAQITKIESHSFGSPTNLCKQIINGQTTLLKYTICTNLWHFYAYLTDCKDISLFFVDQSTAKTFTSTIPLRLRPSGQIFNRNKNLDSLFIQNSYLINQKDQLDLWDCNQKKVGYAEVRIQLKFNEEINRILWQANLIDIEEILVIKGMSPISSACELRDLPILDDNIPHVSSKADFQSARQTMEKLNILHKQSAEQIPIISQRDKNSFKGNISSIYEPQEAGDERMVEDEIDRIIAQMQNKPYDSSKYIEEDQYKQRSISANPNYNNSSDSKTMTLKSTSQQKNRFQKDKSQQKPARYPPIMKTSYPQVRGVEMLYSSSLQNQFRFQSQSNLNNINHPIKTKTYQSTLDKANYQPKRGVIKLKIHELMVQRPESQLSLLLKMYINDDQDQFYSANGMKQGETFSFASNVKIDQRRQIEKIKFELIDAFDQKSIFALGVFQMARLFAISPTKGVFMVNLISPQKTQLTPSIRVEQTQLKPIMPNLKTLRIQIQYEQPLEIVQIYLCLNDFGTNCRSCRYKVPFTKQIIEFRISQLPSGKHINIFPHNRTSKIDKLIIELWGQGQLIGFVQINLKQMTNTNQQMIACSLEAVCLYDEVREVKGLKGAKTKLRVALCYGTVKQVQNLLSQSLIKNVQPDIPKIPVSVQQHLGIYIKQRSHQKQVQIQVDPVPLCDSQWKFSKKLSLGLQQQEDLPDSEEEEIQPSINNAKQSNSSCMRSENQFMTLAMEEKYNPSTTVKCLSNEPLSERIQKGMSETGRQTVKLSKELHQSSLNNNQSSSIQLGSITKQFQQILKQSLTDFQDEQMFQALKHQCEQHLLYNFINEAVFRDILKDMGVGEAKIDTLLVDILSVSSEMVNVNVLYDMIYSLILEGEVKEKYIDDHQLAKYCLLSLYTNIPKDDEQQFVFNDQVEFSEAKKVFQSAGFKITMREFGIIEKYLKKLREDSPSLNFNSIKATVMRNAEQKERKSKQTQNYKKQISSKLYSAYWDEDDDFFISNINQPTSNQSEIVANQTLTNIQKRIIPQNANFQTTRNQQQLGKDNILNNNKLQVVEHNQTERHTSQYSINTKQQTRYKLSVQGFQNCIEAVECHLNISLNSPTLKVTINSQQAKIQFNTKRQSNKQNYIYNLPLENLQYLDGCIQLLENSKPIARCNFSVMLDVRSVYTLKSIEESQFCGLLYLYFADA